MRTTILLPALILLCLSAVLNARADAAADPKYPDWVQWTASPNHSPRRGGNISAIIYHYTAGGDQSGTVKYFQDPASRVSAHYVIGRDGKVVQMVPLDIAAWHAGVSQLAGVSRVNDFSIGIEICNFGKLTKKEDKFYVSHGELYRGPPPIHAAGAYWEPYTDAQYQSLARLTNALLAKYPIRHITGHSDIALPKGRKIDPGAAFDYGRIKRLLAKSYAGQIGPLEKSSAAGKSSGGVREASPKQITNSIGMKLTLVPSGEFMMGSTEADAEKTAAFFSKNYGYRHLSADDFAKELPQHRVRITMPFYLGTFHVTRGQFRKFVNDSGYKTDSEKGDVPGCVGWYPKRKSFGFSAEYSWRNVGFEQTDDHPVLNVSWNDATAFCQWLSKREGKTYRLPTEAEWEYGCRAGTTTRYYSGDDPETLAKVANVADAAHRATFPEAIHTIKANDGYVFTAPVGQFKPNAFGLYDMHGNAEQWCSDKFGEDYYNESPVDDPKGPRSIEHDRRVLRGGDWAIEPYCDRSASRTFWASNTHYYFIGFRIAMTQ